MKGLAKQDRNGTRSSEELRRRYKFGNIELSLAEIEALKKIIVVDDFLSTTSVNVVQNRVITEALNNKVNKETGKGLSTNDLTDELVADIEKLLEEIEKIKTTTENIPENIETADNKVTSINETSTDNQYPSAKAVYTAIKNSGGGISLLDVYPIGSIYMSVNPTNPQALFGGTWEAWGNGRVPVGVDSSQANFATAEQFGGEYTHTLTTAEMPSHTHNLVVVAKTSEWTAPNGVLNYQYTSNEPLITPEFLHPTGGNQPHNNLQPYITCYMWKRTE